MHWKVTIFLLCAFGLLKEFKPTEPFLYQYQHTFLNISRDVLNSEVYPYWTYSYLVLSIPAMLLTDLLLYKPVLMVSSVAYVSVWLTLIYGRSVLSQKAGQILYGFATATDISYFSYAYMKIDKDKYSIVTASTRAALQFGKCFSYFLAQLILLFAWGDLMTLNQISLGSLLLAFFCGLALPWVGWRELVTEQGPENLEELPTSKSYTDFVLENIENFWTRSKTAFSDGQVLRWSIWWALATCGDLLVGNYIQLLWAETQHGIAQHNSKLYNGFVEAIIPLLAALTIMVVERMQHWKRSGQLALCGIALTECLCLVGMSQTGSLHFMYFAYGAVRILYQISITVAQYNIAVRIDVSSSGFVFGLNMFLALALQSALTFLLVDSLGPFQLGIRAQFVVYGAYHALIAGIFVLA